MQKILFLMFLVQVAGCKPKQEEEMQTPIPVLPVQVVTTSANAVNLLYSKTIDFAEGKDDRFQVIQIDTAQHFQSIDGFGYTLTGGSAMLLHQMGVTERAALLQDFFGNKGNAIAVSYLRVSIGASDLDAEVFS